MDRRSFTLMLAMTPGIGGKSLVRTLARNDLLGRSFDEFLSLSAEAFREEYKLTAKAALALSTRGREIAEEVKPLESRLVGLGVRWLTVTDAAYPARLEGFDDDPPGMLFTYGNHNLLQTKTFSVLSSRGTSRITLEEIERLAEKGVLAGEVLVTGHDKPEYQRSAIVPLRWGAPRIICLDRGMFQVLGENLNQEISRAARLWRYEFDATTDLVISPFRPESSMVGANNRMRDRLIAGLSDRIDFARIAEGGNMEALARQAHKVGRSVKVNLDDPRYDEFAEMGLSAWEL